MRHRFFLLIVLLSISEALLAQSAQELFEKGCASYESGNYAQAASCWEQLAGDGYEKSDLYYNLGNAYFRQDNYSQAALWYERALRLAPRDRDIRENLALTYSRTEDQINELPQFFFLRWCRNFVALHSLHGWITVCIILLFLCCGGWVLFFLSHSFGARKWSFVASIVVGVLLLFSILGATFSARNASIRMDAIVMQPISVVKSSPDRGGVDKFILHEGTKVHILEQTGETGEWVKVRMGDGNGGWMDFRDLEVI